ncbi:MAG TPA: PaaI family thioesterase, partial [Burkholderiaceae bacterium]|nr:PaaI family thioesterase [Burkholderiaceae bacterium]
RIFEGELPGIPMSETMAMVPILAERGRVVVQGLPQGRFYNPIGSIHGGFLATLLDTAVGCAVHTVLEQGMGYTTLELKVNYLRGLSEEVGPVRAEGRVVHTSRQIGLAEGSVVDSAGRLYAHATTTCLIFPLPTG